MGLSIYLYTTSYLVSRQTCCITLVSNSQIRHFFGGVHACDLEAFRHA